MIEQLFNKNKNDILINTSYPLKKNIWEIYKEDKFDVFKDIEDMSLYIHIPFCKNLFKFCEYTRFKKLSEDEEMQYILKLQNQVDRFFRNHNVNKLFGFDIGGGTPTCLSDKNFELLMHLAIDAENKAQSYIDNYYKSIEGSFATLTEDKIKMLAGAGFKRVSMGVQSVNKKILESNNREINPLYKMEEIFNLLYKHNIEKINLDLMYGMNNQSTDSIFDTLSVIDKLNPEHVTTYETRFNSNGLIPQSFINREYTYKEYIDIFNNLIEKGYKSDFGMNTFTKYNDKGLSSYLYHRMFNFIPYKGFGISAQSCSDLGVTYNCGKNKTIYNESFINNEIDEEDIYKLPKDEVIGKYISIAMYSGRFSLNILSNILKEDAKSVYKEELDFLIKNDYINIDSNNIVILTKEGFKYYGAVASLFYGKENLKYLENK